MKSNLITWFIVALLVGGWVALRHYGLFDLLTIENLKVKEVTFATYYQSNPVKTVALYLGLYIVMAALAMPGAAILTIAGGALFGFWFGTLLVSFASTIGATLSFLGARYLLRGYVQKKFARELVTINRNIERDGAFYLFMIRLVPAFPFFIMNILMGLTPLKISTYLLVSWVGMLAGTMLYVNAGVQLAKVNSPDDITSPSIITALLLVGIFPLIVKKSLALFGQQTA